MFWPFLAAVVSLIGLLLCVVTVVVVAAIVVCFGVVFFVRFGAGHRRRGLGAYAPCLLMFPFQHHEGRISS